jgi:hypothetical protein
MFVVDDILVSDEVATASFFCNLGACRGACCVQGDSGAPLDASELPTLDEVVLVTRKYLAWEALKIIDAYGPWEDRGDGKFATQCMDGGECVFVIYEGDVAKCSIQKAYEKGRTSFVKPVSCHLFPLRVENYGTHEVINYEWAAICDPARVAGRQSGTYLTEFLREPLIRKYGNEWYGNLLAACADRRSALARNPKK